MGFGGGLAGVRGLGAMASDDRDVCGGGVGPSGAFRLRADAVYDGASDDAAFPVSLIAWRTGSDGADI